MLRSGCIANSCGCKAGRYRSGKFARPFGQFHQRPCNPAVFSILLRVIDNLLRHCLPQVLFEIGILNLAKTKGQFRCVNLGMLELAMPFRMVRRNRIAQRLGPMLRIDQPCSPDTRPGADPYETSDSYRPLEHIHSQPLRLCLRLLTCSEFATVLPS